MVKFNLIVAIFTLFLISCGAAPTPKKVIIVAADGSGQFKNVQDAVDAIPDGNSDWIQISVKAGTYFGHISFSTKKTFVMLTGNTPQNTILTFNNTEGHPNVTSWDSASVTLYNDDFYAENIAFENSHGPGIQALAVATLGSRQQFHNCILSGYQDTLYARAGLQYFEGCTISGAVDFIYGAANALFIACTIHNVAGGAITAADTAQTSEYGITFLNCTLTADKSVEAGSVYLGRTWGPYAKADFLYSNEGAHIAPVGWNNMGNPSYQPTVRVAEYDNTGPGFEPDKRVNWSSQLTKTQASSFTITDILGSWNPNKF